MREQEDTRRTENENNGVAATGGGQGTAEEGTRWGSQAGLWGGPWAAGLLLIFQLVNKRVWEWSAESMASQPSEGCLVACALGSGSVYWAPQQAAHESRVCGYKAGSAVAVALKTPDCGLSDSQSTSVPPPVFTETSPICVLLKEYPP